MSLEGLYDLCRDVSTLVRTMDARLRSMEDRSAKVATTVKELNDYMKKYCKGVFAVKGSPYEVSFCGRLARQLCSSCRIQWDLMKCQSGPISEVPLMRGSYIYSLTLI